MSCYQFYYPQNLDVLLTNNVPTIVVLCALVIIVYPLVVKGSEDTSSDLVKIVTMLLIVYTSQINPILGLSILLLYTTLGTSIKHHHKGGNHETFGNNNNNRFISQQPPILDYSGFTIPDGYFDRHHETFSASSPPSFDEVVAPGSDTDPLPLDGDGVAGQYAAF